MVLGLSWVCLGGSQRAPKKEVHLLERLGMVLGRSCFFVWRYGAILGSVPRDQFVKALSDVSCCFMTFIYIYIYIYIC